MSGPPWYGTMAAPYIMAALQTLADYSTIRQHCRLGLLCSNCSLYRADFLHWRTKYQQAVCLQQDMIKLQHCCVHHIECCCWCAVCARQSAILFLVGRQLLIGQGDISLTHCCQPTNKKKNQSDKICSITMTKTFNKWLKNKKKGNYKHTKYNIATCLDVFSLNFFDKSICQHLACLWVTFPKTCWERTGQIDNCLEALAGVAQT